MYFNGMINLDDWDSQAEYIIFDDFNWDFFPCKKAFWGAQETFTITDKYKKKYTVKNWCKPCIYICNPDEKPKLNTWFKDNCKEVVIPFNFKLFS